MKYLKLFELYNHEDKNENKISLSINILYHSIINSPSLKHIKKNITDIDNLFSVYGMEKSSEIIDKLKKLEPEINKWDLNDEKYLQKDDKGLKNSPTSQLKRVLSLLENDEINKNVKNDSPKNNSVLKDIKGEVIINENIKTDELYAINDSFNKIEEELDLLNKRLGWALSDFNELDPEVSQIKTKIDSIENKVDGIRNTVHNIFPNIDDFNERLINII